MRDSDELSDIPPIVPTRDDVASHRRSRMQQSREIVSPRYIQREKVVSSSSWGVRITLMLLVLAFAGSGYGAYYFYQIYQEDMSVADLRIADLERRLALVGENNEDSVVNIQETLDLHFSEIDKLWAARNRINESIEEVQSGVARLSQVNEGQDETTSNLAQMVTRSNEQVTQNSTQVNTLLARLEAVSESVDSLNTDMDSLQDVRSELETLRTALNSGDSNIAGMVGRIQYLEDSMESVNAHRMQINRDIFDLKAGLESVGNP